MNSADALRLGTVTLDYWFFMLADGALRMLVLLHFHAQGLTPVELALLFLSYESAGVVTNLVAGWLGARLGLNRILQLGTALQLGALAALLLPDPWLTLAWVGAAQLVSGVAKDLAKTAAKSSVKVLMPAADGGRLYRWVVVLTGSKNAWKGAGYLLGGLLMAGPGFRTGLTGLFVLLAVVWLVSLVLLHAPLGRARERPPLLGVFSSNPAVNWLAAARTLLFASRDAWFAIALPLWIGEWLGFGPATVGLVLGAWIVIYGSAQAGVPWFTRKAMPTPALSLAWSGGLALLLGVLTLFAWPPVWGTGVLAGVLVFAAVFAVNSALHSYLIVALAREDGVSLDVGFYYAANALGRLLGTLLSGVLYQHAGPGFGLAACLAAALALVALSMLASLPLLRVRISDSAAVRVDPSERGRAGPSSTA